MQKILFLSILLLTTINTFSQTQIQFKVQYSELYATYDFLTKISDYYPNNELKTIFNQSNYNTVELKSQIDEFQHLRIDYTYPFKQYPQPLKIGMMSRDILERNLVLSQSVADFKTRSLGIIPNGDLSKFSSIIETFLPIYHELVFLPNQTAFEKQKENFLIYVNTHEFAKYFQIGLTFYNTEWNETIPFEINLLPSLEEYNLNARAFLNIAICEASLQLKNLNTLFSVSIHEIDHIIYDNQSLSMKNDIQKWFDNTKSKNSQYALLLMNEVLATAIGNGYVTEQLNGKIEEYDWYENKYITAMAKEIYPVVKSYIENKKPMDEAFIKTYVNLYDTKFPQWNNELEHLFAYRYIVADTPNDWQYIRRTYRKYSNNRLGAPISASEIEKAKEFPITKILVISENNQKTLNLIKTVFSELQHENFDADKEFIKVYDLQDKTKLFIINRHQSSLEQLMEKEFSDEK